MELGDYPKDHQSTKKAKAKVVRFTFRPFQPEAGLHGEEGYTNFASEVTGEVCISFRWH